MSREKTKTSKMILQLHPILMVHADSDFSEFSSLEIILEEVESLLGILTNHDNEVAGLDYLEKLDTDAIYVKYYPRPYFKDTSDFKNEDWEPLFRLFEQRLDFLSRVVTAPDLQNQRDDYCKVQTFAAEQQIIPLLLKIILLFSKIYQEGLSRGGFQNFLERAERMISLCFRVMSSSGRNNPCAIEHLLMDAEIIFFEEIA